MPWLVRDYWQALAAFGLFGVFHSVTAREPFKNALARRTSPFIVDHFWRLLYCLSLLSTGITKSCGRFGACTLRITRG